MTTWQKIAAQALMAIAAGGLLFAVLFAMGVKDHSIVVVPVGFASLYLITQVTRLTREKPPTYDDDSASRHPAGSHERID